MTQLLNQFGHPIQRTAKMEGKQRKNPSPIVAQIAQSFRDRSRKDIGKWRNAIKMAEHPKTPNWQPLMDLYRDLLTDGHLQSQMEIRRSSVLNTSFHIINRKTKQIDEQATEFINTEWFYRLITWAIDAFFFGQSVIQIEEMGDKPVLKLIPRRNVVPQQHKIVLDFQKQNAVVFYDNPVYQNWVIDIHEEDDLGLLNNIVPNLIWKRNIMQSWAEFCERFGIPMLTATTVRSTPEALQEIEDMLFQLGEAAVGVFPEGTNIDFKEANRTDAFQTFDRMIERNNTEISKLLVGGSMVSDDGSSRSQSEVHERNLDDRISATDRRNITFFINDVVMPLLVFHGVGIKPEHQFTFDTTQELDLMEHWQIVQSLMYVADVDMDWVSKTFNVPLKERKPQKLNISDTQAKQVDSKVNSIFNAHYANRYRDIPTCGQNNFFALDDVDVRRLNEIQAQLIQLMFNDKDALGETGKLIVEESKILTTGLFGGYGKRLSEASFDAPDHLMLAMMEQNLFDFSAGKTEARLASLKDLLIDYKEGRLRSFDEFKEEAEKMVDKFNSKYLRTEYNLSVAVGQNSASFMRMWADKDDNPYMQYITAGDNNVRNSHAVLNNKIFNINDSEARNLVPPNGFGCRCEMIAYPFTPHDSGVSKGDWATQQLGESFKKGQFAVNRADLKQVFLKDQQYAKSKGVLKNLNDAKYTIWGLADIKNMKNLHELVLDKSITADNVKELFKGQKGKDGRNVMPFRDYFKRSIVLNEKDFDKHTTGKYLEKNENRHQLFAYLKEVLKSPSEVWLQNVESGNTVSNKRLQIRYIKHYNGQSIVVDAEVNEYGYEIRTWYLMKANEKEIRKGLLVHNKP